MANYFKFRMPEKSAKAHCLLVLIGFGHIADGLIIVSSLGLVIPSFSFNAARNLGLFHMKGGSDGNS